MKEMTASFFFTSDSLDVDVLDFEACNCPFSLVMETRCEDDPVEYDGAGAINFTLDTCAINTVLK